MTAPTQTPHAHDRDREAVEAVAKALKEEREEYWRDPYEARTTLPDEAYACGAVRALRALGWTAPLDPMTDAQVAQCQASFDAGYLAALDEAARLAAGKEKP